MIVLSRRQAREFAAVMRRCVTSIDRKRSGPFVTVRGIKAGGRTKNPYHLDLNLNVKLPVMVKAMEGLGLK